MEAKGLIIFWIQLAFFSMTATYVQCESRRPILRKPLGAAVTGCYFVVLKEKTPEDVMDQLLVTISGLAEDNKIHTVIKKIAKAFTVKLSPYALEMVRRSQ